MRLIRDREGERGMVVGKEGDYYTYRYTDTTRMIPALIWPVIRTILMFHYWRGTKIEDSVHRPQFLKRKESRSGFEPRSLCSVTSLTPYR